MIPQVYAASLRHAEARPVDSSLVHPQCIHALFEEQVVRSPDAIAIIDGQCRLTYQALNARANALAHHLIRHGIGPEVAAAVFLPRTIDMVAAILAILKAGGAYVPLDPAYPPDRLAFLVEDSGAKVIITHSDSVSDLPAHQVPLMKVDEVPAMEESNPTSRAAAGNLAYLIYTSGSTGRPKGVAIEHRNTVSLLKWAHRQYSREELSGVLAATSICFDLSVFELFVPLTCGGSVILAEDALQLPELPFANEVTLINTVPSAMAELVRAGGIPGSVMTVNLAGERLFSRLVDDIYQKTGVAKVYDLYGPSEDTTYSTCALREAGGIETIGRAIDGKQVHILDEHGKPVVNGEEGEIHISGEGLARGYLGREELTAERFLPDALMLGSGGRLYKTGDRGQWLPGGNIRYLGRLDHQVKIRGYRIELGEIETVLGGFRQVVECVATVHEDDSSRQRLAAYVVPADPASPPSRMELREFLGARLPAPLVPDAFVFLDHMPRTPNGKTDRKALPAPDFKLETASSGFAPPESPMEQRIAAIWDEVLGVSPIGIHDSFFELGGHSLLAAQVASRINRAFSIEVPLRLVIEFPTVASLSMRVAELKELSRPTPQLLESVSRPEHLPLSPGQSALWMRGQLEDAGSEYVMPEAFRIRGALDPEILERAIQAIVDRHEILRTRFHEIDGEPIQVIDARLRVALPVREIHVSNESEIATAIAEAIQHEIDDGFDLHTGPLLKFRLLRLAQNDFVLLRTWHHIISDAWSITVFDRELSALYAAFSSGMESPLEPLPVQFADHVLWQRNRLQGERLEGLQDYWKKRLDGAPQQLDLPHDRLQSAGLRNRGLSQSLELPENLTASLERLCLREDVTFFMLLLAALNVLLARYSGQDDIVIGAPVAGRSDEWSERLIGFFVGTLALRAELAGNPQFDALLREVRSTTLDAYEHQDLPLESLAGMNERAPGFQVFFNMQSLAEPVSFGVATKTERLEVPDVDPLFDLTLYAIEEAGKIKLRAFFKSDLFDPETIALMLRRFQVLLESIAADPAQRIGAMNLRTTEDCRKRSVEDQAVRPRNSFNRFSKEDSRVSIPDRFEKIVKQFPDAIAVRSVRDEWTYAELNQRANSIAMELLAACGAGEQRVGLLLGHDLPMTACILGVLKAGKTYVPLDLQHPEERLAYILRHAEAGALIADSSHETLATSLAAGTGAKLVLLDHIKQEPAENPGVDVRPEAIAYLLYTSGSTGTPKGVSQLQCNVLAHIRAYTNSLHIHPGDRLSLLPSYGFDAAVMDIFGALLNGATLCIHDVRATGPDGVAEWMVSEEISIYHSTPTLFRHVAGGLTDGKSFPKVRLVVLGGENVIREDLDLYRRHFVAESIFVNGYGPTESTVTLQCFLNAGSDANGAVIPIGDPVEDTEVLLLNKDGDEGQVYGEIAIRSRQLADGYWREPEMTAACFSIDKQNDGCRIYRTGDLGRLLNNGMIAYAGRRDFQVKIRGQRVEPGEIEAVLAAEPDIAEAAVVADGTNPAELRLIGFVVANPMMNPDPIDLRRRLGKRLPASMIPESIVILDRFPLTASGKVDRKSLPISAATVESSEKSYVAPRTQIEELLAEIWADVLGRKTIGIHDNFFDLGGHSLLAARLSSRISRALSAEVSLGRVFRFPSIAALAEDLAAWDRKDDHLITLVPVERSGKLCLSFAQQRMWFLTQLDDSGGKLNLPSGLLLRGEIDARILEQAINEIIARHESLRTRFSEVDGVPVQIVDREMRIQMPLEDLSHLDADAKTAAIEAAYARERDLRFDLVSGPLIRVKLLDLGGNELLLLRTWHHIVADGWSSEVFHQEMISIYQAFAGGGVSPLKPLALQYPDFADWQRRMLEGPGFAAQVEYWRNRLAGVAKLELPADHPRSSGKGHVCASHPIVLSADLSERLRSFNRRENVTPFMTLLAVFQVLLARHSGQDDIAVGTPIANRGKMELEEMIGFFVNVLVIRTDFSEQPGFRDLVAQVRQHAVEAYHHQDVPFHKLVEVLNPGRNPGHHPLFQVMFSLQGTPSESPTLPGVDISHYPDPSDTSQFDLGLDLREEDGTWVGAISEGAGLLSSETIARMAGHFVILLESLLEDPDRPVAQVPMLSADERRRLLVDWNDTRRKYPTDRCIHHLVEEQAKLRPDAVAVVRGETRLPYRDLNEKANALAFLLGEHGVGKSDNVPVLMRAGPELIVAELAVLKAGAAFVPVDPDWPLARIETVIGKVLAKVLLVVPDDCFRGIPDLIPTINVDLDSLQGVPDSPAVTVGPEDPIYVIFTSGSTGAPKATVNLHAGISNRFHNMNDRFGCSETDVILATTAPIFDSSVWQYFWPLTNGARTVVPTGLKAKDPEQLVRLLGDEQVTVTDFSPSLLAMVVEMLDQASAQNGNLDSLRQVLVGGESIHPPTAYRFKALLPKVNVTNAYGPTETSIGVIFHDLPDEPAEVVPIGKPLRNVHAVILDSHRNPVPQGVPGELYIGGRCVGAGYFGDTAATEKVFVANPFPELDGATLYKTGDLARHRPDGNIEFLGRVDHQLQIRGVRIEPREIEFHLESHPDIAQALAVGRSNNIGGTALVAYLVPAAGAVAPDAIQLRAFLKDKLPDYMVPSAFVILEEFPLAASGKIDRKALPAPSGGGFGGTQDIVHPRDELEWLLEAIWERVLEVEPIGIDQNFFDLGGHSLLVVRLLSEVEKLTGVRPGLADFFSNPTLEAQAAAIRNDDTRVREPGLILLRPDHSGRPIFWAPSVGDIERSVESVQLAAALAEDRPIVAFDAAPEFKDIGRLARHCIGLMRSIQPHGPYAIAGYCQCGHVAFEIAQRLRQEGEEIELLAIISSSAWNIPSRTFRQYYSRIRDNLKAGPGHLCDRVGAMLTRKLGAGSRSPVGNSPTISRFRPHHQAVAAYRPRYCDNEILLILAEGDDSRANQFLLGWDALGPVSVRKFNAPHNRILRNPAVSEVADCIKQHLRERVPDRVS